MSKIPALSIARMNEYGSLGHDGKSEHEHAASAFTMDAHTPVVQ